MNTVLTSQPTRNVAAPFPFALPAAPGPGEVVLTDVDVQFGTGTRRMAAVKNINLRIKPGEFVALLGPSGCGKSTLLNVIAGFIPPTAGRASIDGVVVRKPSATCSVVFQQHSLFPWMTVQENVAFGPQMLGLPQPREIARRLLAQVGLEKFAGAYPETLSGGMRQRVGLARALATDAPVLLLDEPFAALDAQTRELMQELLLTLWEQQRCTVVFVTHDVGEAVFLADRVIVMGIQPGRIREIIPVDLPRPRTQDARHEADYVSLHASIASAIRAESRRAFNEGKA